MATSRSVKSANSMEALWRALEQEHVAPPAVDLPRLSGLGAEELRRFERAWPAVQRSERRRLLQTLAQLAEDDFEMDFNAIFRLALRDEDPDVRIAGVEGLWEDDDVLLLPDLLRLLLDETLPEVRVAVIQCLAHFVLLGETRKLPPQSFRQLCQVLSLIHQNPLENLEVRRRALESLAYASVGELPTLIQAAYLHPAEAMQISAVFAMGRSADLRWREMVMRQLHHPSPAMRYEAARACGELATRDAVPELVELADDVDLEVQEAALWALGQIGGDLARLTLERYLEAESEALRLAADEALQELEFMHGSLDTFFGPPEDLITESDLPWDFRPRQPAAEDFAGDEDEGDEDEGAALWFEDEDDFEDEDEFADEDDEEDADD